MKKLNQNNTIATTAMMTKTNTMKNKMNLFARVVMLVVMIMLLMPQEVWGQKWTQSGSTWYILQKTIGNSKDQNKSKSSSIYSPINTSGTIYYTSEKSCIIVCGTVRFYVMNTGVADVYSGNYENNPNGSKAFNVSQGTRNVTYGWGSDIPHTLGNKSITISIPVPVHCDFKANQTISCQNDIEFTQTPNKFENIIFNLSDLFTSFLTNPSNGSLSFEIGNATGYSDGSYDDANVGDKTFYFEGGTNIYTVCGANEKLQPGDDATTYDKSVTIKFKPRSVGDITARVTVKFNGDSIGNFTIKGKCVPSDQIINWNLEPGEEILTLGSELELNATSNTGSTIEYALEDQSSNIFSIEIRTIDNQTKYILKAENYGSANIIATAAATTGWKETSDPKEFKVSRMLPQNVEWTDATIQAIRNTKLSSPTSPSNPITLSATVEDKDGQPLSHAITYSITSAKNASGVEEGNAVAEITNDNQLTLKKKGTITIRAYVDASGDDEQGGYFEASTEYTFTIRVEGESCSQYSLEPTTNDKKDNNTIYLNGLPDKMNGTVHINNSRIVNEVYIKNQDDGNIWSQTTTFATWTDQNHPFNESVGNTTQLKFSGLGNNKYIKSGFYVTQKTYFTPTILPETDGKYKMNFSTVSIGSPITETFSIDFSNVPDIEYSKTGSSDFDIPSSNTVTVDCNCYGTKTYNITFTPSSEGTKTATILFTYRLLNENETCTLEVVGVGEKLTQTIEWHEESGVYNTLSNLHALSTVDGAIDLTGFATTNYNQPVTYSLADMSGNDIAEITDGHLLKIYKSGTFKLKATQVGNEKYTACESPYSKLFTINKFTDDFADVLVGNASTIKQLDLQDFIGNNSCTIKVDENTKKYFRIFKEGGNEGAIQTLQYTANEEKKVNIQFVPNLADSETEMMFQGLLEVNVNNGSQTFNVELFGKGKKHTVDFDPVNLGTAVTKTIQLENRSDQITYGIESWSDKIFRISDAEITGNEVVVTYIPKSVETTNSYIKLTDRNTNEEYKIWLQATSNAVNLDFDAVDVSYGSVGQTEQTITITGFPEGFKLDIQRYSNSVIESFQINGTANKTAIDLSNGTYTLKFAPKTAVDFSNNTYIYAIENATGVKYQLATITRAKSAKRKITLSWVDQSDPIIVHGTDCNSGYAQADYSGAEIYYYSADDQIIAGCGETDNLQGRAVYKGIQSNGLGETDITATIIPNENYELADEQPNGITKRFKVSDKKPLNIELTGLDNNGNIVLTTGESGKTVTATAKGEDLTDASQIVTVTSTFTFELQNETPANIITFSSTGNTATLAPSNDGGTATLKITATPVDGENYESVTRYVYVQVWKQGECATEAIGSASDWKWTSNDTKPLLLNGKPAGVIKGFTLGGNAPDKSVTITDDKGKTYPHTDGQDIELDENVTSLSFKVTATQWSWNILFFSGQYEATINQIEVTQKRYFRQLVTSEQDLGSCAYLNSSDIFTIKDVVSYSALDGGLITATIEGDDAGCFTLTNSDDFHFDDCSVFGKVDAKIKFTPNKIGEHHANLVLKAKVSGQESTYTIPLKAIGTSATQEIEWTQTDIDNLSYSDLNSEFTLTAVSSIKAATVSLPITYTVENISEEGKIFAEMVGDNKIKVKGAGQVKITASQSGLQDAEDNYLIFPASETRIINIAKISGNDIFGLVDGKTFTYGDINQNLNALLFNTQSLQVGTDFTATFSVGEEHQSYLNIHDVNLADAIKALVTATGEPTAITLTAKITGMDNYNDVTKTATVYIQNASATMTVSSLSDIKYGETKELTITNNDNLEGVTVQFILDNQSDDNGYISFNDGNHTVTAHGVKSNPTNPSVLVAIPVTAKFTKTNYTIPDSKFTVTVNRAETNTTITETFSAEGIKFGETADFTATTDNKDVHHQITYSVETIGGGGAATVTESTSSVTTDGGWRSEASITPGHVGRVKVIATSEMTANYASSQAYIEFDINKNKQEITWIDNVTIKAINEGVAAATVIDAPGLRYTTSEATTYTYNPSGIVDLRPDDENKLKLVLLTNQINVSSVTITANNAGDDNLDAADPVVLNVNIQKERQVINWANSLENQQEKTVTIHTDQDQSTSIGFGPVTGNAKTMDSNGNEIDNLVLFRVEAIDDNPICPSDINPEDFITIDASAQTIKYNGTGSGKIRIVAYAISDYVYSATDDDPEGKANKSLIVDIQKTQPTVSLGTPSDVHYGDKVTLSPSVVPAGLNPDIKYTYSSDFSGLSFDHDNNTVNVTGVGTGAIITATNVEDCWYTEYSGSCASFDIAQTPQEIVWNQTDMTLDVIGSSDVQLTAYAIDSRHNGQSTTPTCLELTDDGKYYITAKTAGDDNITPSETDMNITYKVEELSDEDGYCKIAGATDAIVTVDDENGLLHVTGAGTGCVRITPIVSKGAHYTTATGTTPIIVTVNRVPRTVAWNNIPASLTLASPNVVLDAYTVNDAGTRIDDADAGKVEYRIESASPITGQSFYCVELSSDNKTLIINGEGTAKLIASFTGSCIYKDVADTLDITISYETLTITVANPTDGTITSTTVNHDMWQHITINDYNGDVYEIDTIINQPQDVDTSILYITDSRYMTLMKETETAITVQVPCSVKVTNRWLSNGNNPISTGYITFSISKGTLEFTAAAGGGDNKWTNPTNWSREDIFETYGTANYNVLISDSCFIGQIMDTVETESDFLNHTVKAVCNDLMINQNEENNAKLVIGEASTLNVKGNLTNSVASKLVLTANYWGQASVVFGNDGSIEHPNPKATVEMFIPGGNGSKTDPIWQYRGICVDNFSPITVVPVVDADGNLTDKTINPWSYVYVFVWDEKENADLTHGCWVNGWKGSDISNDTLEPWKGYCFANMIPVKDSALWLTYTGTLINTASHEFILTKTPSTNGVDYANYGVNLLTNSYAAPMTIGNIGFVGANATVTFYNAGTHADWEEYHAGADTLGEYGKAGQMTVCPKNTSKEAHAVVSIPAGQSFFVTANSNNDKVTFNYSDIIADLGPSRRMFLPREHESEYNVLGIRVKGKENGDRLVLLECETCTRQYDNGYDGYKMLGKEGLPQIYAYNKFGNTAVNADSTLNKQYVGFMAGSDDETYTISFETDKLFGYHSLYLTDRKLNETVDILAGETYQFKGYTVGENMRFQINGITEQEWNNYDDDDDDDDDDVNVCDLRVVGNTLYIQGFTIEHYPAARIEFFDMTGNIVWSTPLTSERLYDLPQLPQGIYTIRLGDCHTKYVNR